jgi:hypothetical protein
LARNRWTSCAVVQQQQEGPERWGVRGMDSVRQCVGLRCYLSFFTLDINGFICIGCPDAPVVLEATGQSPAVRIARCSCSSYIPALLLLLPHSPAADGHRLLRALNFPALHRLFWSQHLVWQRLPQAADGAGADQWPSDERGAGVGRRPGSEAPGVAQHMVPLLSGTGAWCVCVCGGSASVL